jgi:hypothetical protein
MLLQCRFTVCSTDSLAAQHLERRGREVSTAAHGPGARAHHDPFMESVRKVQWRYEFVSALLLAVAYLNSPSAAARAGPGVGRVCGRPWPLI